MSFQELDAGWRPAGQGDIPVGADVASGIFRITTAVATFRRLVNIIGSPMDTADHRRTLRGASEKIVQLVKETSGKLKLLSASNLEAPPSKRAKETKLARDFQSVLQDFQNVQRLAVEKEAAYAPIPSPSSTSMGSGTENNDGDEESKLLLFEQKRQQLISMDNEVAFNEAIIEEREQGIRDIQNDVGQVNEIYRDLAVLLHDQNSMIGDIDIHIEKTSNSTSQAKKEFHKFYRSSRSSSYWCCWLLITFVLVLVILLLVLIIY